MSSQINRAPSPTSTRAALDRAIDRLRRNPRLVLRLFAPDWPAVDLARQRAAAAGLADRLSIHHRAARALLRRA